MKRLLAAATILVLAGCGNLENQIQRDLLDNRPGNYQVLKYSGGAVVEEYLLRNVKVTQNEDTDGVYFVWNGRTFEVQGDVTIVRLADAWKGVERIPPHIMDHLD